MMSKIRGGSDANAERELAWQSINVRSRRSVVEGLG